MILSLLHFLGGYVRFTVCGRYPERFINIAMRSRLRLWDVKRQEDSITACMYMRDYLHIRSLAHGAGVRLTIDERRGLPTLLRRYSHRTGVIIGAAAFVITVFVMSLFIWSVDVSGLETISESEMRDMLARNGIYVGAFKPALDDVGAGRAIMLEDTRVGWMAVNVTGSYISVEVKEETPEPEIADVDTPCNVKACRDGRILRIDAEQGTTALKEGSGVIAGQVVVSGVMEDVRGGVRLVRAKARVIAETAYSAEFTIPDALTVYLPTGEVKERISGELFGCSVPLTVGGVSSVAYISDERSESPAPLDVRLPLGFLKCRLYALEETKFSLDDNSAKEILMREARLYEAFSLPDCTVTDRRYRLTHSGGEYCLSVDYTCTEDIAVQEELRTE